MTDFSKLDDDKLLEWIRMWKICPVTQILTHKDEIELAIKVAEIRKLNVN